MTRDDKKDWIQRNYDGNWELFIDAPAVYDAIHRDSSERIADALRMMISRNSDATGNVTDVAELVADMCELADSLEGK